jgi:hypothetical protein
MLWNIRRRETLARRTLTKAVTLAAEVLDTTLMEGPLEVAAIGRLTEIEQSSDMKGSRNRVALESSLLGSLRLVLIQRSVRAKSIYLSDCPHTSKDEATFILKTRRRKMPTRKGRTSKLWATQSLQTCCHNLYHNWFRRQNSSNSRCSTRAWLQYQVKVKKKQWNLRTKNRELREWQVRLCSRRVNT